MSDDQGFDGAAGDVGGSGRVGRRDALKKAAVGLGVAGVVWSAPKIEGLSLRPDYAAAQSATTDIPDIPGPQLFAMDLGPVDLSSGSFDVDVTTQMVGGGATVNWAGDANFGISSDFTLTSDGSLTCTFDAVTFDADSGANVLIASTDSDGSVGGDAPEAGSSTLHVAGTCI